MVQLLDSTQQDLGLELGHVIDVDVDEGAARRSLRDQVARLERDLGQCFVSAFPRTEVDVVVGTRSRGPRLLSLGELEALRDDLAERLHDARHELTKRGELEEAKRVLLEKMRLNPRKYKYVRVTNADIGEDGCWAWHVRPRLGIVGMLAGWWHVKLSSGCPLAT